MQTHTPSIRAAASPIRPKRIGLEAEAQLVPRTGAHSDGSSCTDALRPVIFKLEAIPEGEDS